MALLDTNVLVAFIDDRDNDHDQAALVIDELTDFVWIVSLPVIVEACGLLGSRRGQSHVRNLLSWLLTPGKAWILPGSHPSLSPDGMLWSHSTWMGKFIVDYVDAHLMELANFITAQCELRPHLPIVTFDTKDFMRCAKNGFLYSLYDMRSLELVDFS
ncbi:type II toxin-antitoxin system VapC family toxin [Roseomonas hellenica]|uniref:Type II toxin-antitoxin system VapC family toxin n=1 Tax=Plastoroseomonas hellenica TaxID=2687306 RepID=A0ABS5F452_9PROT|nr:type II toxin-antitoxin system VapC family toxin [Plastoroseomonas hellenica]